MRAEQLHSLGEAVSATGTRARVARVRAEYPDQLDYSDVGCLTRIVTSTNLVVGESVRSSPMFLGFLPSFIVPSGACALVSWPYFGTK